MVDTVAQCLSAVKKQLDELNIEYNVSITRPTKNISNLEEETLYIIRQQIDVNGAYHLIAAAKIGKEKC